MLKTSQMTQKLKTFKKYSTLSHQAGTPWGHTKDYLETILGAYILTKITFNQYYV